MGPSLNESIYDFYKTNQNIETSSLIYVSPSSIIGNEEILDFRLDKGNQTVTAGYVINGLAEEDIKFLFQTYGMKKPEAKAIVSQILHDRDEKTIFFSFSV